MLKTKIVKIILSIIVLPSFFFNVIYSTEIESNINDSNTVKPLTLNEQKNEVNENLIRANEQLKYVQAEISESVKKIQKIEDDIIEIENSLIQIQKEYTDIQKKVEKIADDLKIAEVNYKKRENLLKKRLVAMYNKGSATNIEILLNANNVMDAISLYFFIQKIAEYDSKELENLKKEKEQISKHQIELEDEKAKMKLTKVNAETQSTLLANNKTILENHKASLDESDKKINAEITAYKAQQQEIENLIRNSIVTSTYELYYTGGVMMWPTLTTSYITSPFGSRIHPIQGIIKNHAGLDISGSVGTPAYAAADGIIIYSGWMGGYGNTIMIDHGNNEDGKKIVTLYGHGSRIVKNVGESVKKGDTVLEIGSTGVSTGPHLHFEVRENGVPVDPRSYLSS